MGVIVACLDISTDSWYTISKILWKEKMIPQNQSPRKESRSAIWFKNESYELKELGRDILFSFSLWFSGNLMDAGKNLICKALTNSYQSVLNYQKKESTYLPVSVDNIQLLHNGRFHCFFSFSSSGKV